MKTTDQTSSNANTTPPVEQAAIQSLSINQPTSAMRASGIKNWASLDAELVRLVRAWPDDYSHLIKGLYYRWARVIRKSVTGISAAPVCEIAVAEAVKNLIPRFPTVITHEDVRSFRNDGGDWRVLQAVADLDEPTRLRLAGIFWRWGQIAEAVWSKKLHDKWEREKRLKNPASAPQQHTSLLTIPVNLGSEHKTAIDCFRRRFFSGHPEVTDAAIASHFFELAFLIPDQIFGAASRVIKYSDAEGLNQADARRAMVIAAQRSMQEGSAE